MIRKKSPEDIERLREGGKILARVLNVLEEMVAPGVTTEELNDEAIALMEESGAEPVLMGYHPDFAPRPYPAAICTSINDVIVHGIPNENPYTLKEGDTIGIDLSLAYKKLIVDSARTIPVGVVEKETLKLLNVTREARAIGIKAARVGNHIGDIGHAIETFVNKYGFGIVRDLCGHGVGYEVHEAPYVPNFGKAGTGELIEAGLVLAIEPMINAGSHEVIFDREDGYTVRTKDGSQSAHFEHTVVITENGPEVVTKL